MFGLLEEALDDNEEMHIFEAPPGVASVEVGPDVDGGHLTEVDQEPSPTVDPKVNLNYINPDIHQEHNTNVEEEYEQYGNDVFRMASMEIELDTIATPFTSDYKSFEESTRNLGTADITQVIIDQSRSRPNSGDAVLSPPLPQETPGEPAVPPGGSTVPQYVPEPSESGINRTDSQYTTIIIIDETGTTHEPDENHNPLEVDFGDDPPADAHLDGDTQIKEEVSTDNQMADEVSNMEVSVLQQLD